VKIYQSVHQQTTHSCRLDQILWETTCDPDHRRPTTDHIVHRVSKQRVILTTDDLRQIT